MFDGWLSFVALHASSTLFCVAGLLNFFVYAHIQTRANKKNKQTNNQRDYADLNSAASTRWNF